MEFDDIIPEEDLQAYRKGKHGQLMGFGKRPCLMAIDLTYAFVDPSFALTSGAMASQAVEKIKGLLDKARGIDTLIITGVATSGCILATVVDAASYNYFVVIPEECVADRAKVSHKVNLFDMHMKCADVIPLSKVLNYLETLP